MKSATLGKVTRTAGKMFFGVALLLLAVGAGFGGTALLVYHQLGGTRPAETKVADGGATNRRQISRPAAPGEAERLSQARPVAASTTDKSAYTFADNNYGQPSAPAKKPQPASNVPAPLQMPPSPAAEVSAPTNSNDPESRYIVDSRTGRVIGIDGSVGARREAAEEEHRLASAPRAIAVQTPVPEVRVAAPVLEYGQPIYHGAAPASASTSGQQYVPVRRALPVVADNTVVQPGQFNVAEYLADERSRPMSQTRPAASSGARTARTTHVFRLPDGTQAVVAD